MTDGVTGAEPDEVDEQSSTGIELPEDGWPDDGWEASLTAEHRPVDAAPADSGLADSGATVMEATRTAMAGAPLALDGDAGPNPLQKVRDARRRSAEGRYIKRQRRWETQRYAVPYDVAGPKVTLGVVWFGLLMASLRYGTWLALVTLVVTATIAGLQTGFAWARHELSDRRMTSVAALVVAAAGFGQRLGLGAVLIVAALGLAAYAVVTVGATAAGTRFTEILIRSSLPAGLAAGALLALRVDEPGAFLAVVALVSAYETGDFLIGSGSPNAIEGPVAGLVAMAVIGYGLTVFPPDPFTSTSMPAFVLLAAIGAVLGPVAGSAILPRGIAWSPGLRRLDSYLLTAPMFLLLT